MTSDSQTTPPVQPAHSTAPEIVVWNELNTRDENSAAKFYTSLFNWDSSLFLEAGSRCILMMAGEKPIAGIVQNPSPDMRSLWLPYVSVASVDAALAKAVQLGARVMMASVDVPKVGRIAVFQDPQGAMLGVVETLAR